MSPPLFYSHLLSTILHFAKSTPLHYCPLPSPPLLSPPFPSTPLPSTTVPSLPLHSTPLHYCPFPSLTGGNGADPDNLLALAVIAARERATLGEISLALEAEWGRHVATTQVVQGTVHQCLKCLII